MKKLTKLTKTDTWELFNRWIFMDITHFARDVKGGCFTEYDGHGRYIYADKNCNLYIDGEEFVDLQKIDNCSDLDDFIRSMSNEKYHLIGVFWYNK